jgi:heterodisulfide reductase subunit C
MWDSCQLDGFMREASGHNPLGTEALRTRRRIHHKLAADPTRWGHLTCYLCGRCDAACPTGIGIQSVARRIVSRFA